MPKCACCSNRIAVWGDGNTQGTTVLRAWALDGAAHGFIPIEVDLTDKGLSDLAESILRRLNSVTRDDLLASFAER